MDEIYTSDAELGEYIGITVRQVYRYRSEGKLPPKKTKQGTPLKASIARYIEFLKRGETSTPADREKVRLTAAQADLYELKSAELAGELIRRELVVEAWQQYVANARAKLLTIPTKSAGIVSHETETAVIEAIITDLVYEALEELSNDGIPEKYRVRLESGELDDETADETDGQ